MAARPSVQNSKAHLTQSYNELGRELSSAKIRVVGNYTLGKVIGEGARSSARVYAPCMLMCSQARSARSGWARTGSRRRGSR
jgi:hypothetical protein